jgi:hypothetical protein
MSASEIVTWMLVGILAIASVISGIAAILIQNDFPIIQVVVVAILAFAMCIVAWLSRFIE